MGVIIRQGGKFGILNYVSMLIGFFNALYLFPLALSPQEIGLVDYLFQTGSLLAPFIMLGAHGLAIKYYPYFKSKEKKDNGFLGLLLMITTFGFSLFLLFFFIFRPWVMPFLLEKDPLWKDYFYLIIPVTFTTGFGFILAKYCSNFLRITIPYLVKEFWMRAIRMVLTILLIIGVFSFYEMTYAFVLASFFPIIALIIYIRKMGHWNLNFQREMVDNDLRKEMGEYALYGIIGSLGPIVGNYIDTIMLGSFLNLTSAGLYTIPMYIAMGIAIPTTSILNISAPIISKASKENDTETIKTLYKQSSLNLLVVGILLFLLAWLSADDLFDFMPNGDTFRAGKIIILILGISKLFDMATSINNQILGYSKYYKYNFYLIGLLVVLNITGNAILIPKYDIFGVALASLFALFVFNLLKVIVIQRLFSIHPFSKNHFFLLLIGGLVYLSVYFIPLEFHPLLNITIRSILIGGLFMSLVYFLKISKDINGLVDSVIGKLRGR